MKMFTCVIFWYFTFFSTVNNNGKCHKNLLVMVDKYSHIKINNIIFYLYFQIIKFINLLISQNIYVTLNIECQYYIIIGVLLLYLYYTTTITLLILLQITLDRDLILYTTYLFSFKKLFYGVVATI